MAEARVPPALHAAGGSGPPLVLVHGFGSDRHSFAANQAELGKVASVYTVDLPGHGGRPLQGVATIEGMAADLAASIEAAGIGTADLVGHSLGGAAAIVLAATRPDLLRSLVLIAPAGLGGPVDAGFLEAFPRLGTPEDTTALLQRLVSRPRLINRFMVAEVLRQLALPGVPEGLTAIGEALRSVNPDLRPHVDAVAASPLPRLVIWGGSDPIIAPDMARLATFGGDRMVLDEAAHMPHVESARVVNDRIAGWLSGIDTAAG